MRDSMEVVEEQLEQPYHQTERFSLYAGDCRSVLPIFSDCYFDSVVCDPPYALTNRIADVPSCLSCGRICGGADNCGVGDPCPVCASPLVYRRTMIGPGFMGKTWDTGLVAFSEEIWRECLRVLKPGGHLLAFGGSRTYHRLACAIEDAGFEIHDQIQWLYGSGFPKSLDVSKAIDAAAGIDREVVGYRDPSIGGTLAAPSHEGWRRPWMDDPNALERGRQITAPATEAAKQWSGWGTALKPAHEPIVLARKPLIGTVAENVLQHGTGGLNIDGCRIEGESWGSRPAIRLTSKGKKGGGFGQTSWEAIEGEVNTDRGLGRWPANVIHDGSEEVLATFPETTSGSKDLIQNGWGGNGIYGLGQPHRKTCEGDSGNAARFFYCAKATQEDRNEGLQNVAARQQDESRKEGKPGGDNPRNRGLTSRANYHPTVKPTDLMRYLCRLITPPGGIILDPFCGSGSTGKAAMLEGFKFIGIELNADYCQLAQLRIEAVTRQGLLFA